LARVERLADSETRALDIVSAIARTEIKTNQKTRTITIEH